MKQKLILVKVQIFNLVFYNFDQNKGYEKGFYYNCCFINRLSFSQTKKNDSLLSKNKTSSAKESKGFYKNIDSVSASKYKILNSVPKEQNKYKILKKEEKPAYKFIPTPQTRLLPQPEKKRK